MTDRDKFLAALAKNEDDVTTRLVYADWLNEHGEHEEADRQRKWPAAKEWLVKFWEWATAYRRRETEYDEPEFIDSFQAMMEQARASAERNFDYMDCVNSESLCCILHENYLEFWKNACVYLGYALPPDIEERGQNFHCRV
jgi:uncharacterized protein (TIGR02996 family)